MADDRPRVAVDTVARRVIRNVCATHVEDEWGSYPEIGENDWYAIEDRVREIVQSLNCPDEEYEAAYDYLEERAEK